MFVSDGQTDSIWSGSKRARFGAVLSPRTNGAIVWSSPTSSKESIKSEKLTAVGCRSIGRWLSACKRATANGLRETRRGTANSSAERFLFSSAARLTNSEEKQPILKTWKSATKDPTKTEGDADRASADENVAEFKRSLTGMNGIDALPPEPLPTSLSVDMAILRIPSRQSSR
jgi:hypothetical protein